MTYDRLHVYAVLTKLYQNVLFRLYINNNGGRLLYRQRWLEYFAPTLEAIIRIVESQALSDEECYDCICSLFKVYASYNRPTAAAYKVAKSLMLFNKNELKFIPSSSIRPIKVR